METKRNGRPPKGPPACHPDRPYWAKGMCKPCYFSEYNVKKGEYKRQAAAAWRQKHPERAIASVRDATYRRDYGITLVERDEMALRQGGRCLICKETPDRLCVDHCHTSNKVRGLLCNKCNLMLGHARDDVKILEQAIAYLRGQIDETGHNSS